jgi:hypothetical protein
MPEASPGASPETNPKSGKKLGYVVGSAILAGLIIGGGSAVAVRMLSAPAPVEEVSAAPKATAHPAAPETQATVSPATPERTSDAAAAPLALERTAARDAVIKVDPSADAPIKLVVPMLTGPEIQEKYHISRFIDKETNMLCYVTEADASGTRGPISCVPRPTALVPPPGNW